MWPPQNQEPDFNGQRLVYAVIVQLESATAWRRLSRMLALFYIRLYCFGLDVIMDV